MASRSDKKQICIFTGARSEYGLLKPLMKEIDQDQDLELLLMVSGMHMSTEFGLTYRQIEADGFIIQEKIEILLSTDSPQGVGTAMGLGMMRFTEALDRMNPCLLVILGDRYETFCAAASAVLLNIPIAHIHGGELTYGAWDDAFRHAITKMSVLHFTCTQEYKARVIQMGEAPDRVFNVGALGAELMTQAQIISRKELYAVLGFDQAESFILVTFHPVTRENVNNEASFTALLNSLSDDRFKDIKIVFTKANADSSGKLINRMIDRFVQKNPGQCVQFNTMGQINYTGAMKYASAMVGNSSSGILEAPCFKLPVVNIGTRQEGRIRAENIIDCVPDARQITAALEYGLSEHFKQSLETMINPFFKESTALNIKNIIRDYDFDNHAMKEFFDVINVNQG